jgi:hypothetical protein
MTKEKTEEKGISRFNKFVKMVKTIFIIGIFIAAAIGISMIFPGVRSTVEAAKEKLMGAGDALLNLSTSAENIIKWKYNPTLSGISFDKDNDFTLVARENLDQTIVPVVKSLKKWGKAVGNKFLIFGGTLTRDSSGELVWRINGYDTSVGAVLAKLKGDGIFVVDNPEGLRVPGTIVTTGSLSLTKETVRFLGFLWTTGDRYVLKSSNFWGKWESDKESEFYFTQDRFKLARSESELTPAICAIGISFN